MIPWKDQTLFTKEAMWFGVEEMFMNNLNFKRGNQSAHDSICENSN